VSSTRAAFAERYGPWALVAGASDGVGEAYARRLSALTRSEAVTVMLEHTSIMDRREDAEAAP